MNLTQAQRQVANRRRCGASTELVVPAARLTSRQADIVQACSSTIEGAHQLITALDSLDQTSVIFQAGTPYDYYIIL
jgi:hypothetical protein